jgi:hypothetical protein
VQVPFGGGEFRGDGDGRRPGGRTPRGVRAVADQGPDGGAGGGLLDADARRDLVAHAGVAVLQVVLARASRAPELVQVAGERAGRVDDDVVVADHGVQGAEDLGLSGHRVLVVRPVDRVHDLLPALLARAVPGLVRRVHAVAGQRLGEGLQTGAGVGDQGPRAQLVRVEGGHVEVHEPHARLLEERGGGGGEVRVAGADADDQVGRAGQFVGDGGAGVADAADVRRVVVAQGALAGLGGRDRDAGGLHERLEGRLGLAVVDAAARDDQGRREPRTASTAAASSAGSGAGRRTCQIAVGEELLGPVVRLGLHVLRQGEGDGAGFDRVGEHAHRVEGGGDQRLGAGDPVEVAGDRAQGVVDGQVRLDGVLQLLEQRVGGAGREVVAGQEQHREAVDRGQGRAGDQVGGAGADGGGDRLRGEPVQLAGVADGGVHHGLFVAALVERHGVLAGLQERLADTGDVAMAEDPPGPGDQPVPYAVAFGVLHGQETHQSLGDGQAEGGAAHRFLTGSIRVSRGSTGWLGQVSRIQAWSGWSQISQARSAPGPAMTLR